MDGNGDSCITANGLEHDDREDSLLHRETTNVIAVNNPVGYIVIQHVFCVENDSANTNGLTANIVIFFQNRSCTVNFRRRSIIWLQHRCWGHI
jgi:hypothetical protein